MMPTDRLLAFSAAAFALIVVPGPSVLFEISRAVALGKRAGLTTVAGNAIGQSVQIVAVALGIGVVVQRSAVVFTGLKLFGAAYIVFLGLRALLARRALSDVLEVTVVPSDLGRILREGFVVGVTNPKSAVFFAAVLPQFVDRASGHVPLQLLALGIVWVAIALASDSTWTFLAGAARDWFARSPRRLRVVGGAGGLVMIGLGVRLALTGRKD